MSEESTDIRQKSGPSVQGRRHASTARTLFVLALLTAVAVLGLGGWYLLERESRTAITDIQVAGDVLETAVTQLSADVEQVRDRLQSVEVRVKTLEDRPDPAAGIARMERIVEDQAQRLAALADRVRELAAAVDTAGGLTDERERELAFRMGVIEALSLFRLGRDRLELADDIAAARNAWRRAEQRLATLEDPRVGAPRRELAGAIEFLDSVQAVDWDGLHGRIEAVARGIDRWPPRPAAASAPAPTEAATDESWRSRLRGVFRNLVTVRPRAEAGPSPLEAELARERMRARLGVIELAAAREDIDRLHILAVRAREELAEVFEPQALPVMRARELFDELASLPEQPEWPALDAAQATLEQLLENQR